MIQYRTKDGDTIDRICWKHYERQAGAVEAVLDANPGLSDRGPVLSAGVLINLPELPEPEAEQGVSLWD